MAVPAVGDFAPGISEEAFPMFPDDQPPDHSPDMNACTHIYSPSAAMAFLALASRQTSKFELAGQNRTGRITRMPTAPPPMDSTLARIVRASEIREFMYELRRVARNLLAGERQAHSVSTDALVNTAFLRNTVSEHGWHDVTWQNRQFFFADMVRAMRRSLIDRVRRYKAEKRPKLEFFRPEDMPIDFQRDLEGKPQQIELLEEALEVLEKSKPDLARIVQYHYYVGLTTHEIAQMLEVSEKTVDRDLKKARIFLAETMMAVSRQQHSE
jgi:RNA polymerase sigma factor (TIGR02999 family)